MNNDKLNKIIKILLKYDPIGINYGIDEKEYAPEAKAILEKLNVNLSKENIQEIVFEEFVRFFSPETAGGKDKYENIAKEIYELLNKENEKKVNG